jgi:hypothetical protein
MGFLGRLGPEVVSTLRLPNFLELDVSGTTKSSQNGGAHFNGKLTV